MRYQHVYVNDIGQVHWNHPHRTKNHITNTPNSEVSDTMRLDHKSIPETRSSFNVVLFWSLIGDGVFGDKIWQDFPAENRPAFIDVISCSVFFNKATQHQIKKDLV